METTEPADHTPPDPAVPSTDPAASAGPPAAPAALSGSTSPAAPAGKVGRSKTERSPRDMAMSLLVLLVPIALFLGFYRLVLGGDQPVAVDPAPAVAQARAAAAFPVRAPVGLRAGWVVTSASFRQAEGGRRVLRLGYLTPGGAGVQLVQSDLPVEQLIPTELSAGARSRGPAQVPGASWQRYTARPGEQALVLLEPGGTSLVVGSASERELGELAAALR